jgi:hypothetical protein
MILKQLASQAVRHILWKLVWPWLVGANFSEEQIDFMVKDSYEYEGSKFFWNVGNYVQHYAV